MLGAEQSPFSFRVALAKVSVPSVKILEGDNVGSFPHNVGREKLRLPEGNSQSASGIPVLIMQTLAVHSHSAFLPLFLIPA